MIHESRLNENPVDNPAPEFLSYTVADAVEVDGEQWFVRNGHQLTAWDVNRELDRLSRQYCSAAEVAENHIGKQDEKQWLAISIMRWDEYELARRNLDALLAKRVDETFAEQDSIQGDQVYLLGRIQ